MKKTFFTLILLALFPAMGIAQEDNDGNWFDAMIDSLVQSSFAQFDEKYNTYIFQDKPDNLGESQYNNDSIDMNRGRFAQRRRSDTHSLYATPYDSRLSRSSLLPYPWTGYDEHLLLRYNRVEALFLGLNFPTRYHWGGRAISLFGSAGYGFANHRWRYGGGLSQQFSTGRSLFEVGVEGHSLTDTKDHWIVGEGENSLAAFFLRDDYMNYFGREGFSIWTGFYGRWTSTDLQLRVAYLNDQYQSLDRNTNWSLFGSGKMFRENPPVLEGRMKSIMTTFEIHNERARSYFTSGWNGAIGVEVSRPSLGSDFSFTRYIIELIRYQPLGRYETFNIRLRAGSGTGDLPPQKGFELGGISTLPAFSYKDFAGNRLLLLNGEYILNSDLFDDEELFPSWLLCNLNLILFADAGYTSTVSPDDGLLSGYKDFSARTLKSDWGFGIGTRDAKLRLGFSWRTDVAEPVRIFLRLSRPF